MSDHDEFSSGEEDNGMADLGFLEPIPDEMDPLEMTGKVAGKPIWIHPSLSLSTNDVICGVCNEASMQFLLQINAPGDEDDTPHAAYRVLYKLFYAMSFKESKTYVNFYFGYIHVYCCPKSSCLQESQPSKAIRVFRTQFGFDCIAAASPESISKYSRLQSLRNRKFSLLCKNCGLRGALKSENNEWYCSKECQNDSYKIISKPLKEWSLYTEPEEPPKRKEPNKYENEGEKEDDEDDDEDEDDIPDPTPLVDSAFIEFQERMSWAPRQVIRYNRLDDTIPPLWVSEEARPDETSSIPPCSICKSPRSCEFQIMSTIIASLGIDEDSLWGDFGTIAIYTCPKNCMIPPSTDKLSDIKDDEEDKAPQGFTCEVAWKQDFSHHGINLNWKQEDPPRDTSKSE